MENKNINTNIAKTNLLNDKEFKSIIKFESEYAALIKGGHLPAYFTGEKQTRLVSDVNLLSSVEKVELVRGLFTSKN